MPCISGCRAAGNARARAVNFSEAELPELMAFLRTRGVKGYLTLNTLVFSDELEQAEQTARLAVAAGVDAVLVQDIGLLRLIHRLCPELPLHASTQMTLSSAECIHEIEPLGVRRVVLPRELSIAQIAAIRRQTNMELEAFVHGALCISYSGQCLASLSMGGRSANRGECAQPCRLPYGVLCDGQPAEDADDQRYPLSPHDLAAYDRLPELMAAGVSALKIEGRLKPAEYVASVTRHYRTAIDHINSQRGQALGLDDIAEMEVAFSRGFCHGWLDGDDHRALVSGQSSAKRGTYLGAVRGVRGERIVVELAAPVRRGDGLVFEGNRSEEAEQGGRVYEIFQGQRSVEDAVSDGLVELGFRYGSIDRAKIQLGQKVWKTDDPQAARRLRKSYSDAYLQRRMAIDLTIEAAVGNPLRVVATAATGAVCRFESPDALPEAVRHPLTAETLREQFGRLGKTPYELRRLDARIAGQPMIPLSVLGKLRHEMVCLLDAAVAQPPVRTIAEGSALAALRTESGGGSATAPPTLSNLSPASLVGAAVALPHLHVLCRSMEQIEAVLDCKASGIIVDFRDLRRCAEAVRGIRAGGAKALLATPRIHKPGESDVFKTLAKCRPDGVLARNLAGAAFFRRLGIPTVADFSLNAVNDLAIQWLRAQGVERITAAYDLNHRRLLDLASAVPAEWLEVVVHRHTPMFHSQYCLFCRMFSEGKSKRDCGRPCEQRRVRLRDRLGVEHLLLADSQCRNTLFHAEAESFAATMPGLLKRGVRHFRVELLAEDAVEEIRRVIAPFRRIVAAGC